MTNATDPCQTDALVVEHLSVSYGDASAVRDLNMSVSEGACVSLLGPSGCGKSTTLRAIAGLERPTSGRISIFGSVVYDGSSKQEVPPEKRNLSMVFQNYAIWPHLTVFENVAYGLRLRGIKGTRLRDEVGRALDTVGLGLYADRPAPQLSGGQQQRVALARSIAYGPKLLLLDEPLSNLDAILRAQMRVELIDLQKRLALTSIFVTHDLVEALTISDRIVVMRDGRVQQVGDPNSLYFRPENAFVADFVGSSNILPVEGSWETDAAALYASLGNGASLRVRSLPNLDTRNIANLAVKAIHVQLSDAEGPQGGPNQWKVQIRRAVFTGDMVEYFIDWAGQEVRSRMLPPVRFQAGDWAIMTLNPNDLVPMAAAGSSAGCASDTVDAGNMQEL
jgi:iron(III) transport system ATP-binding protein